MSLKQPFCMPHSVDVLQLGTYLGMTQCLTMQVKCIMPLKQPFCMPNSATRQLPRCEPMLYGKEHSPSNVGHAFSQKSSEREKCIFSSSMKFDTSQKETWAISQSRPLQVWTKIRFFVIDNYLSYTKSS